MMFPITAFYAALCAVLFIVLSLQTVKARRRAKVPVGDGGDVNLLRAMRAHGHFAEYMPFLLLMMVVNEGNGAPAWLLHGCGGLLVLFRLMHVYSLRVGEVKHGSFRFRVLGMVGTMAVLSVLALSAAYSAFLAW